MRKPAIMVATAAVAALIAAGCTDQSETGGDGPTEHDHGTSHSDHGTGHDDHGTSHHNGSGASPGPADGAAEATHNGADVIFAQHMIPHHSQAVEMSDILLAKQDVDPRVRQLAEKIKAAQAPEIEQMQGWLDSWGNPPMPEMDHSTMDGMVAPEGIEKLRSAAGPEATKLFLEQMIGHHEGAVTMAQDQLGEGRFEPAKALSRAIIDSQQREIDEMKQILESL